MTQLHDALPLAVLTAGSRTWRLPEDTVSAHLAWRVALNLTFACSVLDVSFFNLNVNSGLALVTFELNETRGALVVPVA